MAEWQTVRLSDRSASSLVFEVSQTLLPISSWNIVCTETSKMQELFPKKVKKRKIFQNQEGFFANWVLTPYLDCIKIDIKIEYFVLFFTN